VKPLKNTIKFFVVVLTALSFSSLSFAQAKPATPATPATPPAEKKMESTEKAKTTRIHGELTAVDAKAGTFAVKEKDKEFKLTADSQRAKRALEKVKVGDMVQVSYHEKDGKMIATAVQSESKTKAAKSEAKSETADKKTTTK
jgi:hypothetical protein